MFNSMQIEDMKKHLEKRVPVGTRRPKLKDMDPEIPPAAWSILRWYVHA
jgi:ubiquitin-conjugating enzyme E2 Q